MMLPLRPLTFLREGDEVVVGCPATDSYAVLPGDGAALLQRLGSLDLFEAQEWYAQTYGGGVDMDAFVETLREFDFLDETGPTEVERPEQPVRWQGLGRAVFSPAGLVLALGLVGVAVSLVAGDTGLLPRTGHVFFSRYLLLIEVTVAVGQIPLIAVHEVFHVLAARRLGVPARIRVSQRLYFVVFETSMDGLVAVPRRQRFLPVLAGMLADVLVVCALTIAAALASQVAGGAIRGVCLALAFTTVIRFLLEFVIFLRTDIYYLICLVSRTLDLHTTTTEMIANRWWRLLHRADRMHDPHRWHPRDVRAARWYLPVHLLGYLAAIVLLAAVLLPISWRFATSALDALLHPGHSAALFWDALGLLLLNVAQPAAAGLLWLRQRAATRSRGRLGATTTN